MLSELRLERDVVWDQKTVLYRQNQYTLIPFVFLATVHFNNEPLWDQYTLTALALHHEKLLDGIHHFEGVFAAVLLH